MPHFRAEGVVTAIAVGGVVLIVLALFVAAYYAGGWALNFMLGG